MNSRPSRVVWTANTDAAVLASPVLVDDVLFAIDAEGFVYAFDATDGSLRWRAGGVDPAFGATWAAGTFNDSVLYVAPAVSGDLLFVPDIDYEGCVFVYQRHTGEVLSRLPAGCPTVVGDVLLIIDVHSGVRAFSLPDLAELWYYKGWTGLLKTFPAVADGIAYAAYGFEGHHKHTGLCAFGVTSGDEIFQCGISVEMCPLPAVSDGDDELGDDVEDNEDDDEDEWPQDTMLFGTVHPVAAEGLVWMPVRRDHDDGLHEWGPWTNGEVVGLDPRTGDTRWHFALDLRERSEIIGAVVVADGTVYFTAVHSGAPDEDDAPGRHMMHAVDIATGRPRWSSALSGMAAGSPAIVGGRLYAATDAGQVHAFDAASGQQVWTVATGHEIVNKYDLVEDFGAYYEEDGQAVLPGEELIYLRTRVGIVALAA